MDRTLNHVYIGSTAITTPLGFGTEEVWQKIKKGKTGLNRIPNCGQENEDLILSKYTENQTNLLLKSHKDPFFASILLTIKELLLKVDLPALKNEGLKILFSTTKGHISDPHQLYGGFKQIEQLIIKEIGFASEFKIVSTACTSGVSALNLAHDLIQTGKTKNVMVVGADQISIFTTFGFQSFFALSNEACKPYDEHRKGINLGEGAAAVLVSKNKYVFKEQPMKLFGGASANDANHISGPSRNGEGLFRSIQKTLTRANKSIQELDFISAHGTATLYNDDMESWAFHRMGAQNIPLNSLKPYFGHTLGAAGLIETIVSMISARENLLVPTLNFETPGTVHPLNVIKEIQTKDCRAFLKTASGFGGMNSSLIIEK